MVSCQSLSDFNLKKYPPVGISIVRRFWLSMFRIFNYPRLHDTEPAEVNDMGLRALTPHRWATPNSTLFSAAFAVDP